MRIIVVLAWFFLAVARYSESDPPKAFLCQLYLDLTSTCYSKLAVLRSPTVPPNGNVTELFLTLQAEWLRSADLDAPVNSTWQIPDDAFHGHENDGTTLTCKFTSMPESHYQCVDFTLAIAERPSGNTSYYDSMHYFLTNVFTGQSQIGGAAGQIQLCANAVSAGATEEEVTPFVCSLFADRTTGCTFFQSANRKRLLDLNSASQEELFALVDKNESVEGTWEDWPGTDWPYELTQEPKKLQSVCVFNYPSPSIGWVCFGSFPRSRDPHGKIRAGLESAYTGTSFAGGPGSIIKLNSFHTRWLELLPQSFVDFTEKERVERERERNQTFDAKIHTFFCNFYSDDTTTCYVGHRSYSFDESYSELFPNALDEWLGIMGPGSPLNGTWKSGAWPLSAADLEDVPYKNASRIWLGTCCFNEADMNVGRWQCNNATDVLEEGKGYFVGPLKGVYMGDEFSGGPEGEIQLVAADDVHLVTGPIKRLASVEVV